MVQCLSVEALQSSIASTENKRTALGGEREESRTYTASQHCDMLDDSILTQVRERPKLDLWDARFGDVVYSILLTMVLG